VTIEKCDNRIFPTKEYAEVGCQIVDKGSWVTKAPLETYILGLKTLGKQFLKMKLFILKT
jgi:hypothetical protein